MFGFDLKVQLEKFLKSGEMDEVISDVIGEKIEITLEKEGNIVTCRLFYGDYEVSQSELNIS